MVKHIVCFKLKQPDALLLGQTRNILESMKGQVPMLRSIEVGIDALHSNRSYDIVLITSFDSFEDLAEYQNDAYHCSVVKKHMHAISESSVAVDYSL
jgi:hypothetical protein